MSINIYILLLTLLYVSQPLSTLFVVPATQHFRSTLRQTDYALDTQIFDVLRSKQIPNESYTKLLLSLRYTKVLFCP